MLSKRFYQITSGVLALLCILLGSLLYSNHRREQTREDRYMRDLYTGLYNVEQAAEAFSTDQWNTGDVLRLHVALDALESGFKAGDSYIKRDTVGSMELWCTDQRSTLYQLSCETHPDRQAIQEFAVALFEKLSALRLRFVGEDGLNFNSDTTLEQWNAVMSDFYAAEQDCSLGLTAHE